jgi:hypothetical protein
MLNADSLPRIVKAQRMLRDALAKAPARQGAVCYTVTMTDVEELLLIDRDEFRRRQEAETRRFYDLWRAPTDRQWDVLQLLMHPESYGGLVLADLDERLPLKQRVVLRGVWDRLQAIVHADGRDALLVFLDEALAVLSDDGPRKPDKFRWKRRECGGLSLREYQLLDFLWDEGRCRRNVTFQDLREEVWGYEAGDGALRTAVSRVSNKLAESGIHLGLGTSKYTLTCAWGK